METQKGDISGVSIKSTQLLCFSSSFLNSRRGPGEVRSGWRAVRAEASRGEDEPRVQELGFCPKLGSVDLSQSAPSEERVSGEGWRCCQ